jgi:hypothetical protein
LRSPNSLFQIVGVIKSFASVQICSN